MHPTRRTTLSLLATACTAPGLALAQAQPAATAWPTKPIRLVVPLAAGSAVDNAARVVLQKMSEGLGQGVVIENIPGSAGLIGAEKVARAAPDGYTLGGFNDSVLTMVPHLHPRSTWNALTDFDPVSLVGTVEWGLVVRADSPHKTVRDLLAAADAADVNLIILESSSTPRQPGGRNWLWQRIEVKGLEEGLQRPRLADVLNAVGGSATPTLPTTLDLVASVAIQAAFSP